jgi:membrane-anchored protein YejM (alkaline phosphatase superfamily)
MDALLEHKGFGLLEDAGAIGGNVRVQFAVWTSLSAVNRILGWIDALAQTDAVRRDLSACRRAPPVRHAIGWSLFRMTSDINRYRNALHYGDEALGALLTGPPNSRPGGSYTAVVVFGDHGEAFGQHARQHGPHALY